MPAKRRPSASATQAARADRHALYEQAVQNTDADVAMLNRVYMDTYGTAPRLLREDFCGTAAVASAWVRQGPRHQAHGVDLDPEVLAWGTRHNLSQLSATERSRLRLHQGDARTTRTGKVDVVAVQNFSFFLLRTRPDLRTYLKNARASLRDHGVLLLDVMGGPGLQEDDVVTQRKNKDFTYVGEQSTFDPITHEADFHIHFLFPDGSKLRNAFEYRWRLWFLPELRETLAEAGFSRSVVYWRMSNPKTGDYFFRRMEHAPARPTWLACVVGIA